MKAYENKSLFMFSNDTLIKSQKLYVQNAAYKNWNSNNPQEKYNTISNEKNPSYEQNNKMREIFTKRFVLIWNCT